MYKCLSIPEFDEDDDEEEEVYGDEEDEEEEVGEEEEEIEGTFNPKFLLWRYDKIVVKFRFRGF